MKHIGQIEFKQFTRATQTYCESAEQASNAFIAIVSVVAHWRVYRRESRDAVREQSVCK